MRGPPLFSCFPECKKCSIIHWYISGRFQGLQLPYVFGFSFLEFTQNEFIAYILKIDSTPTYLRIHLLIYICGQSDPPPLMVKSKFGGAYFEFCKYTLLRPLCMMPSIPTPAPPMIKNEEIFMSEVLVRSSLYLCASSY